MDVIEAIADSWASLDGRAEAFRACKSDQELEEQKGYFGGYMADAAALLDNLHRRGFDIVSKPADG